MSGIPPGKRLAGAGRAGAWPLAIPPSGPWAGPGSRVWLKRLAPAGIRRAGMRADTWAAAHWAYAGATPVQRRQSSTAAAGRWT